MSASVVRRWLVAVWIACAGLGAGGAPCYVIDLSGGPNANHYPVEMLESEPVGGWTAEHKTTKLVLRRIEPGTFMMCNTAHVTLTRPFYIGVFEVTSAQYQLVMGTTGGEGDARPEADISYDTIRGSSDWPNSSSVGADTFLGRLRARTGLATFDLPTEAQWEYACRAGTTSDYNNGGNTVEDLKQLGRFGVNEESGNGDDGHGGDAYAYEKTVVGSYLPNAWGLYDMHGNVREWCLDYYGSLLGGNDPVGGVTVNWRVLRGGGFESAASNCGAAWRESNNPSFSAAYDGFRVVCFPAEIVQSSAPYEGVYDGEGHGITVTVATPQAAVTRYALSEAGPYQDEPILFTNATATVTVWYEVSANGYDTVVGSNTVTIAKATYDMSGVAWDYAGPFEGDGAVKTVALTNLPAGVTASYTGNTATRPGTYTAHAVLAYDATNYEAPAEVADLIWKINEPVDLSIDSIIGYPVAVGSDGAGAAEGIADDSAAGLRSVKVTTSDNHEAWFEVVVTNALSVSFDWRCSCEELPKKGEPYDYMKFSVDDARLAYIGGETAWTNVTFELAGDGVQTLRWTYAKDVSDFDGEDCAWVANVVITYAQEQELRFTSVSAENGEMIVAVSVMEGEISSTQVKNMLEATRDLSDWEGGALPMTVTDLTEGVAQTVWIRVTFQGAVSRAFLRLRE